MTTTPVPAGDDARPELFDPAGSPPPRRLGLLTRRAITVVALLAGLGAAGLAGGHAVASIGGHRGGEPGESASWGHDDGADHRPMPGPVAPSVPGR